MIRIIDYGLGNIQAFLNVFKRLNVLAGVARRAADLDDADRLILPGVGAFDHAMQLLEASGMRPALDSLTLDRGIPVLGICVGMQILARASDEGTSKGLGWLPSRVRAFKHLQIPGLMLPHMGWNDVTPVAPSPLFRDLGAVPRFYFLHSYYFECKHAQHVAATSSYGIDFACAVTAGNVHGVQFHPEKSHHFGAQLLKNFSEL